MTRLRVVVAFGLLLACGAEAPVPAQPEPLAEAEARAVLAALGADAGDEARAAVERVRAARDRRFTAVFIELLRAAGAGLASPAAGRASAQILPELTGESHGEDWRAWAEWYAGSDLAPPPGFTDWKGRLLSGIDPAFGELLQDAWPRRIRSEEIVWGGVAYEGIPALERPPHLPASEAAYLGDDEPVFGLVLGGEARAYPLRILDWHELANDELGGVAFSLAYCTLCSAGIAYRTTLLDGVTYDFGSSGLLYRSNKLMVDRQTRSLWSQLSGRPVLGPLANRDELRLTPLPSVVTRWADWRERHPDTHVLSLETGHARPYEPGAAYGGYFASPDTMFPVRHGDGRLAPKARVFGLELDGGAVAYPLDALVAAGVTLDRVRDLVIVARRAVIEVEGRSLRRGAVRYRAGAPVRAYQAGGHVFRPGPEAHTLRDESGGRWQVEEDALLGPQAERLERRTGALLYWFAWSGAHPDTALRAGAP